MSKRRVIITFNVKPGADSGALSDLKKLMLEEFIPAEKEAPGLLSIEAMERFSKTIPHVKENFARDFAFTELWEDAESYND